MLIRIVKMTFKEDEITEFQKIFESSKLKIRNQKGCKHLELLRDINSPSVFITCSYWDKESDLNTYRNSELFGKVWKGTKALFSEKPQAWSLEREWLGE
tara:strand:+ start:522 stop:818 length:297 start_codon:yes stop_codon:yes gene_type:complete